MCKKIIIPFFIYCVCTFSCTRDQKETPTLEKEKSVVVETPKKEIQEVANPLLASESYKKIAAFIPNDIDGTKGGVFEGWAKGVTPGVKFSFAKKKYRDLKNKTRIDLSIADAGLEKITALGLNRYWINKNIDKQTASGGYEKTIKYKGFSGFEKCENNTCDVYFVVDDRFLIGGYIEKLPIKKMYEVFDEIDIEGLRNLTK